MEKKYVIKTPYGAYIGLVSKGLKCLLTKLEDAPQYTLIEVKNIKTNFKSQWERDKLQPFELVLTEKPVTGIF